MQKKPILTRAKAPQDKTTRQQCAGDFQIKSDTAGDVITCSFSSTQPYERWNGIEVLEHGADNIRLTWLQSGNAPLLWQHNPDEVIGVVERAWIAEGKCRADIRFGTSLKAVEVLGDVKAGILKNISVGYRIHGANEEEQGNATLIRVTDWEPFEISIVSVPADTSVGLNRHSTQLKNTETIMNYKIVKRTKTSILLERADGTQFWIENSWMRQDGTLTPEGQKAADGADAEEAEEDAEEREEEEGEAEKAAAPVNARAHGAPLSRPAQAKSDFSRLQKRRKNFQEMGETYNVPTHMVDDALRAGLNQDQFAAAILQYQSKSANENTAPAFLDMPQADVKKYSLKRAINAQVRGNWQGAGLEWEASVAIEKRNGSAPNGVYVPLDALRTANTASDAAGGHLVPEEHVAGSFIDLLRNKSVTLGLGLQTLPNLRGNLDIPKQTGACAVSWVGEDEAPDESDAEFGNVTLSPKTAGARTRVTRRLLQQSDPSIDALLRNDILASMALGIDLAILNGTGANNKQPLGVMNVPGIGYIDLGANGGELPWAKILKFAEMVESANALIGNLAFITTPRVKSKLKDTARFGDGTDRPIWADDNTLDGYKAHVTNQLSNSYIKGTGKSLSPMVFGNWADVIVGEWGTLDLQVDPYSDGDKGNIILRTWQDIDVAVRHAESFVMTKDIIAY